ncbi:hypothetical protein J6E39_04770 [bacterium]|nr:hypothetical protein [bacterium]
MSGIQQVGTTLSTYLVRKPLQALSKTSLVKKATQKSWSSDDCQKLLTGIGIGSVVLKDGFGCYLYVKQSLNNKKIPEDKRKFVAALDLTNGGLMIALQLLMYATISRPVVQSKMFKGLCGKYVDRAAKKGYYAIMKKQEGMGEMSGKVFHESVDEFTGSARKAFGHLSTLIASTIIGKRVLVPFIATPLADKAKAWMARNDKPVTTHPETVNTYNPEMSAADAAKKEQAKPAEQTNNQPQMASEHNSNLLDKYKKI